MDLMGVKARTDWMEVKKRLLEPMEGVNLRRRDPDTGKFMSHNTQYDMSRGQIMNAYNQYKNAKSKELMDRHYGKDQLENLFGKLTESETRFADEMFLYIQDVWEMVNPVHVEVYQADMGHVENYWPRRSEKMTDQELLGEFAGPTKDPQFIKRRGSESVPIFEQDAMSVWQNHEYGAQYMINNARTFKKISDLFRTPAVANEIKDKWGKGALKALHEQIDAASLNGTSQSRAAVDGLIVKAVGQLAVSKIAFNPISFIKQLSSYHLFSNRMPTGTYYKELMGDLSHPRETLAFMKEHVGDFLEERLAGGFNEVMKNMLDYEKTAPARAKLNNALTYLTRYGDHLAIGIGGAPRLRWLMNEKGADGKLVRTKDQAIEIWKTDVLESQQAGTTSSLNRWQREQGIGKILTIFKNSQGQFVRKIFEAVSEYQRGEISGAQATKQIINYSAVQAALFVSFGYLAKAALGQLSYDDKDLKDLGADIFTEIMLTNFDVLPFARDIADISARTFLEQAGIKEKTFQRPAGGLMGLDDINKAIRTIGKPAKRWHDYADIIAPFIEMSTSLPISQYTRYGKRYEKNLKNWGVL
jgi:hypothetical protein